jgi:hypothetical protein
MPTPVVPALCWQLAELQCGQFPAVLLLLLVVLLLALAVRTQPSLLSRLPLLPQLLLRHLTPCTHAVGSSHLP